MFDLDKLLAGAERIGISGHVRPDGDCIGSCLGLFLYVRSRYPEKMVRVYLEETPERFAFLAGADEICHEADPETVYDLFFLLDCSEESRLGRHGKVFRRARVKACIDHHVTGKPVYDYNYIVPDASSASELVCDLIGTERITKEMAEALYLGIAHDTGIFQYACTSSHTMSLAGALMEKGINFSKIVEDTYFSKTYWQKQILGRALLESIRMLDGRVIFSAIRRKDLEFYCVKPSDLDGIVSELRSTKGVDTAIFLYETGPGEWKVSLRSSEQVDVARVAALFGGGGHIRAAGCSMQGSVYDVVNNLVLHIEEQLLKETPHS